MIEFRDDDQFFNSLFELELDRVFNPYKHVCSVYDSLSSPECRRRNIKLFFEAAKSAKAETVWVGRDLGYRGGRRTGLPLTDEGNLGRLSALMNEGGFQQATKGAILPERTANAVWDLLAKIDRPIFLWNVFPYHPHGRESQMENRSHTALERSLGIGFLRYILDILKPNRIISIGRDAQAAVSSLGFDCVSVRHPSYGGQTDFANAIAQLYDFPLIGKNNLQFDLF
ncbi:uracil-DNA glycosylase [Rhizobium viscosum]|uniref:Uracil-DNA glycosylase-like domain-containing protein n=1 Tax=Rhizobium viscosum TaxID=1673 RepID=A0ABR9IUX9_RHIVS|nr:uracil-DNA glycosylase [Rhizobium viscosum]MBE1506996.1 hypothetical protein [Rhizobium viscosum]